MMRDHENSPTFHYLSCNELIDCADGELFEKVL